MEHDITATSAARDDQAKVSLRNDIIFKYVFGHEKNEMILRGLLNEVLGLHGNRRLRRLTFIPTVNLREFLNDKLSQFDVSVEDRGGKRYNIEMQVRYENYYIARAIYYHDKLYTGRLKDGTSFKKLKKALSISLLNFVLLPEETDLHNIYRYGNIKSGRELTDLKELHFIELPKFTIEDPLQLVTRFEKWLYALKYGERYKDDPDSLPASLKAEEDIVMAIRKMHEAEDDAVVKELMEMRRKARHDEATRLDIAREQAKREERAESERKLQEERAENERKLREAARRLMEDGVEREKVKAALELSDEDLEGR